MLKPNGIIKERLETAAAFGRLCVETIVQTFRLIANGAAAFGRLCVETSHYGLTERGEEQPPSGGCVLKHDFINCTDLMIDSRLRAAVC